MKPNNALFNKNLQLLNVHSCWNKSLRLLKLGNSHST